MCADVITLSCNKGSFDLGKILTNLTHDIVDKCMTQHDSSVDFRNRGGNQYLCVGTSIAVLSDYMLLAALPIPPVEVGRHTG